MRNGRFPDQRRRPDDYGAPPPVDSSDEPRPSARPRPSRPSTSWPPDSWPRDSWPPEAWPPEYREAGPKRQSPPNFPPARSALGLRRVLALFGLVVCGVAAGWFAVIDWPVPAAVLALLALVAVVDLVVIQRRIRHEPR